MPTTPTPKPNTFIIGAPKSGTTSLVEYLREHPQVFFSIPKEPYLWADDFSGIRAHAGTATQQEYLRLFATSTTEHKIRGEGSTLYFASQSAVKSIMEFNPDAKIIVMLRHPVDLVYSFYRQQLRTGSEDQTSFESAWAAQEARAEGKSIPSTCIDPMLLQYRMIGRLGQQLERVMSVVPREQLLVIFFDEFANDTSQVYRTTLNFLDLEDDNRTTFEIHNPGVVYRAQFAQRLFESSSIQRSLKSIKAIIPLQLVTWLRSAKDRVLFRKAKKQTLEADFRQKLLAEFRNDVERIESLTGRQLDHWKNDGLA